MTEQDLHNSGWNNFGGKCKCPGGKRSYSKLSFILTVWWTFRPQSYKLKQQHKAVSEGYLDNIGEVLERHNIN